MYKTMILILFALTANASSLTLVYGQIKAHTEVFGDKNINPSSEQIKSNLTIENKIISIQGDIFISSISLQSDNKDRDKHMYKSINAKTNPYITFKIKSVTKIDKTHKINGTLTLNGISKNILSSAIIKDDKDAINISGLFSINLTDYGIEPPILLFLSVRNKIDITYNLTYKKDRYND